MKTLFRLWIPGMCFWCENCQIELERLPSGLWLHPIENGSWWAGTKRPSSCPHAGMAFKAVVELEKA